MGNVVALARRRPRLGAAEAGAIRAALVPLAASYPTAVARIEAAIQAETCSQNRWEFVMISPAQFHAVVCHLVSESRRLRLSVRLWSLIFGCLDHETGEVMASRRELAVALGCRTAEISAVMAELAVCGAVLRRREVVAGVSGPGQVRYFVNPRVGTHLAGQARDAAQASAPPLDVAGVEAGRRGLALVR